MMMAPDDSHGVVDQAGGGIVGGVQPRNGSQFDHIKPNDFMMCNDGFQSVHHLIPVQPTGFRGTGSRDDRWVQAIDINGQIYRRGKPGGENRIGKPGRCNPACVQMPDTFFPSETRFFVRETSNSDLIDVKSHIQGPMHDTRMAQGTALISVAQIGMRVKLNDSDFIGCVSMLQRPQGTDRHGMLTAQQNRYLVSVQNGFDGFADMVQCGVTGSFAFDHREGVNTAFCGDINAVKQFQLLGGP